MIEPPPHTPFDFRAPDVNANSTRARYFRLGRHALLAAFNIINLRSGDSVLVPAFICKDVLAPIHAVGAVAIFYEVGVDMTPVNLPEVDGVRAVLAVNYFGFPQDMLQFRTYCKRHGAALIEDNTHGLLSCDKTGTPLGTRGDIGIFSIRKTFVLPDGAMLMLNKPEWQGRLEHQLPSCRKLLPPTFWIKRNLSWLQRRTGIVWLAIGQDIARSLRYWRTGHSIAPISPEDEFEMPENPAPHRYSLAVLHKLDLADEISRRRQLYTQFSRRLSSLNIHPVFGELPVGVVPYGYPFYADEDDAQSAIKIARTHGFDCSRWPDLPTAVLPIAPFRYQSLWVVNFIC